MEGARFVVAFVLSALAASIVFAYDPNPLQDICVAVKEPKDGVFVNGKFCKDPKLTTPDDFVFSGLHIPRQPTNIFGFNATIVNVDLFPGLNTNGITVVRIDYAPHGGQAPPHVHPRGTETVLVLEGTLYAGFSTADNRLFSKQLYPGDLFVIPLGLIHFQMNTGDKPAVAIAILNSQNPGFVFLAPGTFGTNPPTSPDLLTRTFQLDKEKVLELQKVFAGVKIT